MGLSSTRSPIVLLGSLELVRTIGEVVGGADVAGQIGIYRIGRGNQIVGGDGAFEVSLEDGQCRQVVLRS